MPARRSERCGGRGPDSVRSVPAWMKASNLSDSAVLASISPYSVRASLPA
jgi:hypothetical protein